MRPARHGALAFDSATNHPLSKNLENIERTNKRLNGTARSPRATEDMKVLREAAENRKQRSIRLSIWANRALSEEQGRALPARATIGSTESQRPGSRAGTTDRQRHNDNGTT